MEHRNTASMNWKHVLLGGGVFDNSREHPNQKGWDIFELGQKSFWAVPTVIEWDQPVRENPEYANHIAAMLSFLCPGEKTAVLGASRISTMVTSADFRAASVALTLLGMADVSMIPKASPLLANLMPSTALYTSS